MSLPASSNPVDDYARRVVAGEVPAGRYHRLSCARHLRDREREDTPGFPYRFRWTDAERFLRFAGKLKHYKGKLAGTFFQPSECQVFRLGSVFGWRHIHTGRRRFTTAYNELPRKSGKSFESAVVALYVVFFEGEPGAEGYCIATKRAQARRVFDDCRQLVRSSSLHSRIAVQAGNLHMDSTSSKLEPLGADADSTDGLNPHFICTDEFHAQKTRDLIDVMETATGARLNPLHYQITTAGNDPVSPCGDQHDYICKILDGLIEDDATNAIFGFIAHADPGDDWLSEDTWKKASPHYGISIEPDDIRKLALKAVNIPSAAATFQQKHLNIWVNADTPWLSLDGWRKGQSAWSPDDLLHESCWVGVDLASQIDLCAMVFVFPPKGERTQWRLLRWVWTPRDTMVERSRRDRAPYDVWERQGHLIAIDGVRMNHAVIRDVLKVQRERYKIEQIGFDPWHADQVVESLIEDDGFSQEQVVMVPQTYAGMSKAALGFEAAVLEGAVDANGCPLMSWCVSNVVVQRDGKDNIYPVKKRSRGRIDPVMATIIAWRLAELGEETQRKLKRRAPKVWTPSGFVSATTLTEGHRVYA